MHADGIEPNNLPADKRLVVAPSPENGEPDTAFISVLLSPNEDVQWVWTHRDGRAFVTGYEIVDRLAAA